MKSFIFQPFCFLLAAIFVFFSASNLAFALDSSSTAEVEHANAAQLFALDKITGKTKTLTIPIGDTAQFGSLQIKVDACAVDDSATRSPSAYLNVSDISFNKEVKLIFSGWMMATSPGLNAIDHPVYDIWLKDCVLVK